MASSAPPIGIDLGTTFSVAAYLDNTGRPQTVKNSEGDVTTPSVVFFEDDLIVVGKEAIKTAALEPELVAQFAKRDMGLQHYRKTINGKTYPPEVIQSMILKKIKKDVEAVLGPIDDVVITVPAFFNEPRRKATQDAGRLAGMNVRDIINEPTAAAVAFGVQKGFLDQSGAATQSERIFIYDLGGGTFDVTVMEINGNEYKVLATDGNVKLGGIDWDLRIADHVADKFIEKHSVDPREDPTGMARLLREAEDAKRALSARSKIAVAFEHKGMGVRVPITRDDFMEITADLLERTRFTVVNLLRQVQMEWKDITRLMLVGGSTRMPMVADMLERVSGKSVDRSLAADEAVAHGAAIYAGLLRHDNRIGQHTLNVSNVNSHSLGVMGIERQTGRKRRRILIPANTPLPAKESKRFPIAKKGQRSVKVEVVEGGDDSGHNSTPIGTCVIRDLPRDLPENTTVIVTFRYESNGRLNVRAGIPGLQKEARLDIQRATGMSESDLKEWEEELGLGEADEELLEQSADGSADTTSFKPQPTVSLESPKSEPKQLREYKLLEKLGEGGMGTVYKAEHSKLKKTVALKILPAQRMRDAQSVERFQREMEAVGRLDHPNIVRALDAGEVEGTHFLVMEFVDGIDLDTLARRTGTIPVADACELIRQAALGLDHANEYGLVHRDVKPSNLMLKLTGSSRAAKKSGVVKILDLGLARLRGQPTERMLTSAGQVIGTVDYMAPEQGQDSNVDIRADIYSLGCSLYRLLAGRPPFEEPETNLVKTMLAHAQKPVPPIQNVRSDVPDQLVAILDRMLAKNPADRFTEPDELAAALQPFAQGNDLAALVDGRPSEPESALDEELSGFGGSAIMPTESPSDAMREAFDPQTSPDRALQLYRQYEGELECSTKQYLQLAQYAVSSQSPQEALELFDKAKQTASQDNSIDAWNIALQKVDFLLQSGGTDKALNELRAAIEIAPDQPELHVRMSDILSRASSDGRLPPECLTHAARAVELRPDDVEALRLASRASWHEEKWMECLEYAQGLYGASPSAEDQFEACLTMGLVYMQDEEDDSRDSAIEAFESALEIDAAAAEVLTYLTDCYWRSGRYEDAYQTAQKCLSVNPDDEYCGSIIAEYEKSVG